MMNMDGSNSLLQDMTHMTAYLSIGLSHARWPERLQAR